MRNDVNISARMITEYYLPAFKACVQDAKVKSIMCRYECSSAYHQDVLGLGLTRTKLIRVQRCNSYNAVNGVPSCANGAFQNGVLREKWGVRSCCLVLPKRRHCTHQQQSLST